jgi:hypothetical protein
MHAASVSRIRSLIARHLAPLAATAMLATAALGTPASANAADAGRIGDEVIVPAGQRDASGQIPRPLASSTPQTPQTGPTGRAGVPGAIVGPQSLLILRVDYDDDRSQPYTEFDIHQRLDANPWSASAIYRAQSDNAVSLTGLITIGGDISNWLSLAGPLPTTSEGCDYQQIAADAYAAAAAANLTVSPYQHVMILFPHTSKCSWGGLGEVPGRTSWINGLTTLQPVLDASLFAHELGHNQGIAHAASVACTDAAGKPVAYSDTCSDPIEYGDPFDLMGGGYPLNYAWSGTELMSSWHRAQLLELPAAQQKIAASAGTYALDDASTSSGSGTRLLRVPRNIGPPSAREFVLELRGGGTLFDTWSTLPGVAQGVIVRLAPDLATSDRSQLIDTNPDTASLLDAPLTAGRTFTDPVSGLSITVASIANGHAQIQVAGNRLADVIAPTFTGDVSVERDGLDAVVSWAPATDDMGVTKYEVVRDGLLVASVGPGTTSVRDRLPVGSGTAVYRLYAVDAAGNRTAAPSVIRIALIPAPTTGDPNPVLPPAQAPPPTLKMTPGAPTILRPVPTRGAAKLSKTGRIVLAFPGAGKVIASLGHKRLSAKAGSQVALIVPRSAWKKGTVKLSASGGTLAKGIRAELRVRKGVAKLVVLS